MTILTKPSNEKKSEKLPLPDDVALHGEANLLSQQQNGDYNSDYDTESMQFNRSHHSFIKSLVLFLISLIVMMMGILGGYTLYRMYAPTHSTLHYRALCDIPYTMRDNLTTRFYAQPEDFEMSLRSLFPRLTDNPFVDENFFREEIEMDLNDEIGYTKIDIPDFKEGRRGRFMHDFKENQSAIIDTSANRCFVMSLDRNTTLPPKSFLDLMQKMGSGYYNIDTERVRKNMRIVTPPITDLTTISERIANECVDMNVYKLENYVSGISKRSAKLLTDSGKFAEFLGKGIVEFDLLNIADIEQFEKNQLK